MYDACKRYNGDDDGVSYTDTMYYTHSFILSYIN